MPYVSLCRKCNNHPTRWSENRSYLVSYRPGDFCVYCAIEAGIWERGDYDPEARWGFREFWEYLNSVV